MLSLTHSRDLVADARVEGIGIGAFNVVLLEHAEAIVAGAERAGLPVILQISQNCIAYHASFEPLGAGTLALARAASVPVMVHLDHADDRSLVEQAVHLGFQSVMFDGSRLPYEENVRATADVVLSCARRGVYVEAEIGEIGGKDGAHAVGARTDPAEAAAFAESTGVDWLAVAVGTSHAMTSREAQVDEGLIARIAQAAAAPLVLHGSSGLSDEQLRRAVRAGMTKVNISTHLNGIFTGVVREVLSGSKTMVDPRQYVAPAREAITAETARLLRVLADPT